MKAKHLIELTGIGLLLAVIGLGYRYAPQFMQPAELTMPVADCDPGRQNCQVTLPDGATLTLALSPQPVPLVKPFQVAVHVQGMSPRQIDVDFAAVGMDMGYNRPRLRAQPEAGHFAATTSLPVCITGPMQWQATVLVETLTARIAIPFRFSTRT